jgi:alpha-L-fucosidase
MVPSYLSQQAGLYAKNPRQAALAWFKGARYGLFLHYGVYSLLGRGEWVQFHERIPVAEYEKLKDGFTAADFDANAIADLAVEAGMSYVNITTRHHDSFCLFGTAETDFHSVNSPAGRDLVGELAEACAARGLGLFLYYSYGADWRHPYFMPADDGTFAFARPHYETPEPAYLYRSEADLALYFDFVHRQLRELLTNYGPIAGIWFDPIMGYYYRPDLFPVAETYALIRSLQPQCLIAYKNGANGDEDFASPEHVAGALEQRLRARNAPQHVIDCANRAWDGNRDNPRNEICTTLTNRHWGYCNKPGIEHRTATDVLAMLADADANNCNLLLNTGPLPDGGIDPVDAATLRQVGEALRRDGFPRPGSCVGRHDDVHHADGPQAV